MLTAIIFVIITFLGYFLALWRGPFWGLISYANVYFNVPDSRVNWWAEYIPNLRWSLLSAGVLIASMILHRGKLSKHKLNGLYLVFIFYIYTQWITIYFAVDPMEAKQHTYYLLTFCLIMFFIVKSIAKFEHLRLFLLTIIIMAAYLVFMAHFEGRFINGRLNDIGPFDANQANEFGILLASIISLTFPFIFYGKRYEKAICLSSLLLLCKGLVMTVSRGAMVSFIFGVAYVFIFITGRKMKTYILFISICASIAFLFLAPGSSVERISTLWSSDSSSDAAINRLSSGRWAIWKYGLSISNDHPLGVGPSGFKALARFYMPPEILVFHPGAKYGTRAPHNTYLQVLVEQGYIGLCFFMIICFYTMCTLFQSSKKMGKIGKTATFSGLLTIALTASFVSILVGGLFSSRIYYEFFWWQIAIIMVASSFIEQQHSSEEIIPRRSSKKNHTKF